MTEGIGERGLVVYQGDTSGVFISPDIQEGDRVVLYPLKDVTRIAVPILSLSVGDCVFTSPEFKFAGFDWKLDFNFDLIPLSLPFLLPPWFAHKFQMKIITQPPPSKTWWVYGDSPPYSYSSGVRGCKVIAGGPNGGDLTLQFEDLGVPPYDMNFEIKFIEYNEIEVWVYKNGNPSFINEMYFDGTYLCKCGDANGYSGGPYDETYHGILSY